MRAIGDLAFRNLGWLLFGGLAFSFALVGYGSYKETEANEAAWQSFRADCERDRKPYECVAMWRAGNTKTETTVIPVPVVVGR